MARRSYCKTTSTFRKGERVQLHPATDQWMAGDRYGTVTGGGKRGGAVRVKMDRSGKSVRVCAENLLYVE